MIEAKNVSKSFGKIRAVDDISLKIEDGRVFGLIGTNGAGKSTFLRLAAGVLKPDSGSVEIDGREVFEEPEVKENFFYISDDTYFFSNSTPDVMAEFYRKIYPNFSVLRFGKLMDDFSLDRKRKINTFSKGMKKQLSVILGLSAMTKYMYCDETFDGLDPVMRQGVKSLFAGEMTERGFTPVIASHNLRELEDICDTVGLLHKGGILLSEDLDSVKADIHKLHCVFRDENDIEDVKKELDILIEDKKGTLYTLTVRGMEEQIMAEINAHDPVFAEMLPLSLEEIFISETGVTGYDIKKIIC
ncbi:MAG: ABC transporter ATP-binding protein [Lachnospiraceae bacterium]|nr:ABC transporter ATP-binding protein [Lachnospiraceae bacterium]